MTRSAALLVLGLTLLALPQRAAAYATFEIAVIDDPNEGFNDPSTASPIGGNPGTTLGEQRLNALRHAADLWGAQIDSNIVIKIEASFDPIECLEGYGTTLALGGTTWLEFVMDIEGDEVIVPTALGDRIEDYDLEPGDPDISIQFNSDVDNDVCLGESGWYYGFDGQPGFDSDMVDTALHEIAHGLGIQSLHDAETGELIDGVPPAYLKRVFDLDTGKHWDEMTTEERLTSQGNARRVVWDGPRTTALTTALLQGGMPDVASAQVPGLSGHYADASFGTWSVATTINGELVSHADDDCAPATVNGKVVLLSWDCSHSSWVSSIESSGAVAFLIESSADWDVPALPYDEEMPFPVGVPVIAVSTVDFNLFKDALMGGTVNVELSVDEDLKVGGDDEGRVMMNITSPRTLSSIAHVEPLARPNLLMEPFTTQRPLHTLDITPAMLHDIGWVPFCGNGTLDQAEECDDGEDDNNDTEPDACRTTCVEAACGDGVIDDGEACDDGEDNDDVQPNACRTTCVEAACGDGVIDDGEVCDNGAQNSDTAPNACRKSCVEPSCGDGVLDLREACDDGSGNADDQPNACRTTCKLAVCGDGVIDEGEACDDGEANSDSAPNACRTSCERAQDEDPDASSLGDGGTANDQDAGDETASGDKPKDDSGCGCRTIRASSTPSRGVAGLLLVLGLVVFRATRRRI